MNELITLLAGATGAAVIKIIDGIIQWKLKQKEKKQDKQDDKDTVIENLKEALRVIMLDRIQYLCKAYINDKEVDFDDRRRLHMMHAVYHNNLKGNGDLDLLMQAVDGLPLKPR